MRHCNASVASLLGSLLWAALLWTAFPPLAAAQTPPVWRIQPPQAFSNLGPIAGQITAGTSGNWTAEDQNGRLLLTNTAGAGDVRAYTTEWQGDLAAGRSVSLRVLADGQGKASAAGIMFRVQQGDPDWLAFVATSDGRVGLYAHHPNRLEQIGVLDIAGGHLAEGDLLTLNQKGDVAQLLVNGRLVTELKPEQGANPNGPGPVGIVAMDTGRFAFNSFGFGRPVVPLPPDAAPQGPVVSSVASLGDLARNLELGDKSGWISSVERGQLVYTYAKDDLGYYYRSLPWPGPVAQGRSATITVDARGDGKASAAGLAFGIRNDGDIMYALAPASDGKIKLYRIGDDKLDVRAVYDPPSLQPGGGKHMLKISQTADRTVLYADGKQLGTLSGAAAQEAADGGVGLVVISKGRYGFQDFALGAATAPSPPPPPPPITQADPPRRTGTPLHSFSPETFGALFGIMAHEFGHFMIGELNIPATGPEEDVADEFAAMVFIDNLSDAPDLTRVMALGNAELWWFMALDHGDNSTPFYDEHAPDKARFAKFSCMLYGAAPQVFESLMDEAGIPDRSKKRCINDEPKRHAAWDKLLTPLRRRGVANIPGDLDPATPGHKVSVVYEEPRDPAMRPFAHELRDSGVFEVVAEAVTKQFVLPRDTKIVFRDCGVENCFYQPSDGSVTMCWEMITFVMQEFQKHGQNAPTPPSPSPPSPTPPNGGQSMDLSQFLLGRWHERTSNNGMVIDMQLELGPQGMYRAQLQVLQPQQMTVNVQGNWQVSPAGGNRAQINFVPTRWTPPQAPMQPNVVGIELVDRNTFRTADGVATRQQ